MEPSPTQLAYLAGIIDGEGWIGWHLDKRHLRSGRIAEYRYPRVEVSMTTHGAIDLIHKFYPSNIRHRENYPRKRSPTWSVVLSGRQTEAFLKEIRPYLLEKSDKADEMLEYYREQDTKNSATLPSPRWNQQDIILWRSAVGRGNHSW